jgi:hypothetical protein
MIVTKNNTINEGNGVIYITTGGRRSWFAWI